MRVLNKNSVVGLSVTPEAGIEIAQVDYATRTVQKYGRKPVDYNLLRREIADLDLFKDALQDFLEEMEIPKGTELVLTFPTVNFQVADFPASLDDLQMDGVVEEAVYDNPYLKNYEPCCSYAYVNKTLQSNKVAFTAIQKSMIIEVVLLLKELGYKVSNIDTSINSVFRSLVYLNKVNTDPETNWVLLTIENSCCRILSMAGRNYMDAFEEKISIGEVLGDAENYSTVLSAVEPHLRGIPAKYLFIVSKTNVISAEVIANKITYSAPIIYQEANNYKKELLMNPSSFVTEDEIRSMTLDVIGAAIYKQFSATTPINFNFFNKSLGDIYWNEQPPSLFNGKLVLTNDKLILFFILFCAIVAAFLAFLFTWYTTDKIAREKNISEMESEIAQIEEYIRIHNDVSQDTFDEGEEIRTGLAHNKGIYSYYTIVGTEIPQKLWLTHLKLGNKVTIDGQADNIESIYAFFRNIKDYNTSSEITLQKLSLATSGSHEVKDFDKESILTSLDADFYEFSISNDSQTSAAPAPASATNPASPDNSGNNDLPGNLEPIN